MPPGAGGMLSPCCERVQVLIAAFVDLSGICRLTEVGREKSASFILDANVCPFHSHNYQGSSTDNRMIPMNKFFVTMLNIKKSK